MLQPSLCPERGARCTQIVFLSAFAFAFAFAFASVFVVVFFLAFTFVPLRLSLPLSFYYTKVKAVFLLDVEKHLFLGQDSVCSKGDNTSFV